MCLMTVDVWSNADRALSERHAVHRHALNLVQLPASWVFRPENGTKSGESLLHTSDATRLWRHKHILGLVMMTVTL